MADTLEPLVASIYGSLTGPDGHAAFVRALSRAFKSHIIAHQVDRPGHAHIAVAHYDQHGRSADELAAVASRQPYVNPWFESPMAKRLFRDGVADDLGCIEPAKLRGTEFYADILQPFDIFHTAGFLLEERNAASIMTISRSARTGYYEPHEVQLGHMLLPHLRNIYAIQKALSDRSPAAVSTANAVWALSEDGRICGRNQYVTDLLTHCHAVIGERADKLWLAQPQDRVALDAEIADVLAGRRLAGQVPIRDITGTPRYIAQIRHCRQEAFLTWLLTDPPAAMIIIRPLGCDASQLEPFLSRLYQLTAAECRVAAKFVELESINLVAAALCRSEQTIRSQVKAIFVKTGTRSQAQLLKLLYSLGQS